MSGTTFEGNLPKLSSELVDAMLLTARLAGDYLNEHGDDLEGLFEIDEGLDIVVRSISETIVDSPIVGKSDEEKVAKHFA